MLFTPLRSSLSYSWRANSNSAFCSRGRGFEFARGRLIREVFFSDISVDLHLIFRSLSCDLGWELPALLRNTEYLWGKLKVQLVNPLTFNLTYYKYITRIHISTFKGIFFFLVTVSFRVLYIRSCIAQASVSGHSLFLPSVWLPQHQRRGIFSSR